MVIRPLNLENLLQIIEQLTSMEQIKHSVPLISIEII